MGCGAVKAKVAPGSDADPATKSNEVDEPEKEPALASAGSSSSNRLVAWGRSNKQRQRIRRQRGDSNTHTVERDAAAPGVSSENRRFLVKVLQRHFLFAGLEDEERDAVIDYMTQQKAAASEKIFDQGQRGDCCYFIQSGVFTVTIDGQNVKQLKPKHSFGELALLYNVNRTATVCCNQEGLLLRMDRNCFHLCMTKLSERHIARAMSFFRTDPHFCSMNEDELKNLATVCSVQVFGRNEQILREGEVGDWMFIIIEGNVQTVDHDGNSTVKSPGTILGSAGMIMKQQITGAKAIDRVTCLALARNSLERLLGSVEDVIRRSAINALLMDNHNAPNELAFFKALTVSQQNAIIDRFESMEFTPLQSIVITGAPAQLVLVTQGELAIMNKDFDPSLQPLNEDEVRGAATEVLSVGMAFGGGALLGNVPMREPVIALTHGCLHRLSLLQVLEALNEPLNEVLRLNELKKVLGDIFLFKNLPDDHIDKAVRCLQRRQYTAGETIVEQGQEAHNFYLIHSGTIHVVKDGQSVRSLGRWDYFGERGLLTQERRSATCQAIEACTCFSLEASVFVDIVGSFRQELEHRMHLQDLDITMNDLRLKAIVGRGSFGIVKLVHHCNDESKSYALKCVSKKQVVRQGQQKSICMEREINAQCYHPCIMQFIKTFQDPTHVYFLTEFLGGGDLFYAIREIGNLSKEQSQFYGGSITVALEYLHARSIMYRDLKPENVLLDFKGCAKLVDFGCCKKTLRTNTLVGTPEYFAPETILGKGYTGAIDWWALGVMMHEFIVGPLPFGRDTDDQLDLFREILEAPLSFPSHVTDETAVSIISGLLERTPELRLGASTRGAREIKEHYYYAGFSWDALVGRYMKAPWRPDLRKLQATWEPVDGAQVFEDTSRNNTVEPGMEWTLVF